MWLALTLVLAAATLAQPGAEPSMPYDGSGTEPHPARLTRLECVSPTAIELEVASIEPFPVRDALTELQIGPVVSSLSRYPEGGDTHTLIFALTPDELRRVAPSDLAVVRYNPSNEQDVWLIGSIDPAAAEHCADTGD